MGKLIVTEGLDGCGKSTQTELLYAEMHRRNPDKTMQIKLPDYSDPSSTLVRMYLGGEFSSCADGLSPYAASIFYAADRIASFKRHWQPQYDDGYTVIADRYTTSNAIYQLSKLPACEWDGFLHWIEDTEYVKLGLPRPDAVIFLDVPPDDRRRLLAQRYNGDESRKDIHERDEEYLDRCREAAEFAANKWGWHVIRCTDGTGALRNIDDIHRDIIKFIDSTL